MFFFYDRFGQVAIDDAQLGVEPWVALVVRFDDRGLEIARAWQDRAQVALRQPAAGRVRALQHEELVATGGDAALDAEEVGQGRPIAIAGYVPVVVGVFWVRGPLAGRAQTIERDRFAGVGFGDRSTEGELDGVFEGRGRF